MKFTDTLLDLITGRVPDADPEDHAIARRAYADFIDLQLAGFNLLDNKSLRAKLYIVDERRPDGRAAADFPTIMGVETRLVAALTDALASRTYWIVRDRFNRVASSQGLAEYARWAPPELHEALIVAVDDPLAVARHAETAALAAVGRASLQLDQAKAAHKAAASDDSLAALDSASKVYDAAIAAATRASQRVAALEAAAEPAQQENTDGS